MPPFGLVKFLNVATYLSITIIVLTFVVPISFIFFHIIAFVLFMLSMFYTLGMVYPIWEQFYENYPSEKIIDYYILKFYMVLSLEVLIMCLLGIVREINFFRIWANTDDYRLLRSLHGSINENFIDTFGHQILEYKIIEVGYWPYKSQKYSIIQLAQYFGRFDLVSKIKEILNEEMYQAFDSIMLPTELLSIIVDYSGQYPQRYRAYLRELQIFQGQIGR